MSLWTIVLASGSGQRFGSLKQFADFGGRTVTQASLESARSVSDGIVLTVPRGYDGELSQFFAADVVVAGGSSRSESVRCALEVLPSGVEYVLIHDAARPNATPELFRRVRDALLGGAISVVPAVAVTDTVKETDGAFVVQTLQRDRLVSVQTPQGFRVSELMEAHAGAGDASDDAAVMEAAGYVTEVVPGEVANVKITYPEDLTKMVRDGLSPAFSSSIRVGSGYDVHPFADDPGRRCVIGGVTFEHRGLLGHSDADVLCHAIADALLGAVGIGGIGDVYFDNDPANAGADSTELLRGCISAVREAGFRVGNVDATVVCESPRIAPERHRIEELLSGIVGAPVCVKAKRAEGLGSLGRREGIAAFATVLMFGVG